MSADDTTIYFLDCPFAEKGRAKTLGAQFDGSAKRWFVPPHFYPIMRRFNRWRPLGNRVYLDCPYSEKTAAKQAGAKWDPTVKAWYATVKQGGKVPAKFSPWLTADGSGDAGSPFHVSASSPASSSAQKKPRAKVKEQPAPSSAVKKRGNAQDATTLRISDSMTVGQLQDECRIRGIKGLSGKNKEWLLENLGAGSVWQTMNMSTQNNKVTKKREKAAHRNNKEPAASTSAKAKATPQKKAAYPVKAPPAKKAKAASPKKRSAPPAKKAKAATPVVAKKKTTTKVMDWSSLPQVASSLTIAQLTHELLHRQPSLKGTSNKAKPWFLEALGEYSIWTTSPDLKSNTKTSISNHPVVSSSLTIAQLTHELMSRRSASPTSAGTATKGLSSKGKTDLLKLVGEGSIWTTAPPPTEETSGSNTKTNKAKSAPATAKKAAPKKKTAAVPAKKKDGVAAVTKKRAPSGTQPYPPTKKSKSVSSKLKSAPAADAILPPNSVPSSRPISSTTTASSFRRTQKETGLLKCKKMEATPQKSRAKFQTKAPIVPPVTASSSRAVTAAASTKPKARPALATESAKKKKVEVEIGRERQFLSTAAPLESNQNREFVFLSRTPFHEPNNDSPDDDLKKFPEGIRNPPIQTKKLKYTVWTKSVRSKQYTVENEFNSSFSTLEQANLRVEYVFYYNNPWGFDKDEIHADEDKALEGGLRYMRCDRDGGRSLTVSVMPTEAFDNLIGHTNRSTRRPQVLSPPPKSSYAKIIRDPKAAPKKLQFTVWTSLGFDYDGWHSYQGQPKKEFNSTFATLEQANKRAEYVFYYQNPWSHGDEELPCPDSDEVNHQGFRHLECCPDDSQRWTVAVVLSVAFAFINY